jgi:hypothetical protein
VLKVWDESPYRAFADESVAILQQGHLEKHPARSTYPQRDNSVVKGVDQLFSEMFKPFLVGYWMEDATIGATVFAGSRVMEVCIRALQVQITAFLETEKTLLRTVLSTLPLTTFSAA